MVEEALVKETLTQEMILAGKELTNLLEHDKLPLQASLWLYLVELNGWKIIIASDLVVSKGPRYVYEKIQSLLTNSVAFLGGMTLNDISVVTPDTPLMSALRKSWRSEAHLGIRLKGVVMHGQYIDDAYIYQVA